MGASYTSSNANAPYFTGPYRITNPLLGNVQEAVSVGDSDGRITWQLGSNEANGFRVFELEEPSRLVIDVCISDASLTKGEDCIDSGMPPVFVGHYLITPEDTQDRIQNFLLLARQYRRPQRQLLPLVILLTSMVMAMTKKHLPIMKHTMPECIYV